MLIALFSFGLVAGCSQIENSFESENSDVLEQKNATISITGTLSQTGGLYLITDSAGMTHDIESYSVSFDEYLGETVTVTGQYSGDTLFVTEVSR